MKFINKKSALLIVVLLGAVLRFYKLGEVPSGVYVDEAALGYNAFSIARTGLDEYGHFMPIFLRSFSAYSSPLYVYISAIPVSIFGLSAYSIRLLSAVSGVLNIVVIYLIVNKLFKYKSKYTPALAALSFAISPWSIFFSRAAFEANFGLLLLSISLYLMLFVDKFRHLLVSAVLMGIASYSYQSLRFIPLLLIPTHFILFRSKEYNSKRILILLIAFFVVVSPHVIVSMTPAFGSRAGGLFYSSTIVGQADKVLFLPRIISIPLSFTREFGAQLFSYFSPRNLFLLGDPDLQRSIPELGVYYSWIVIPLIFGLYSLAKKLPGRNAIFIFAMMFIFAAPAALSKDPFSSLRALNLLIPFSIVIALGIDSLVNIKPKLAYATFFVLVAFSLLSLWRSYFVLFASERVGIWNYGYEELARNISESREHFVIDNSRVKPPHILLAFFMEIDPKIYQEYSKTKIVNGYYSDTDFDTYYNLLNFETRPIDWQTDIYKEQVLVGDELAISEEQISEHYLEEVFKIYDSLNKQVFQGYRTNPEEKCRNMDSIHCI